MESMHEYAFKVIIQDFMKLNHFEGSNIIHWKDKMMFLWTALKISYVLDPELEAIPNLTDADTKEIKAK